MSPAQTDRCGHEIDEWLHKKADGRLVGDEAAALERQLAECTSCRERAALLDWAVERLRVDQKAVPVGLADAILGRTVARPQERPTSVRLQPRTLGWLGAAAVAVLAIVAGLVGRHLRHPGLEAPTIQVELQLARAGARSVAVAGDFNGWDAVRMKQGDDGVWRVRLSLSPGRYQYAFLVDRRTWIADPRAASSVDSGYGGADSVLDLSL